MNTDSKDNRFYVYGIYEPGNDLPLYIGKGSGPRIKDHLQRGYLKRPTPLHCKLRSLLSKSIKPDTRIIASDLTEDRAFYWESLFIAIYGRRIDGSGCLFNCTLGGEGSSGAIPSNASRQRMREAHLRRPPITSETRKAISKALKGRSITWADKVSSGRKASVRVKDAAITTAKKLSKPLVACDAVTGIAVLQFDSRNHAVRQGFNAGGIFASVTNPRRLYKNFKWRYV